MGKRRVKNSIAEFKVVLEKVRMGNTIAVQVKLTATERCALDEMVRTQQYDSRSSALREGLGLLFEKHGLSKEAEAQIEEERRRHYPRINRKIGK